MLFRPMEGFADGLDEGDQFWKLSAQGDIEGPFVVECRNTIPQKGAGVLARDRFGDEWEFLLEDLRPVAFPSFRAAKKDWRKRVIEASLQRRECGDDTI